VATFSPTSQEFAEVGEFMREKRVAIRPWTAAVNAERARRARLVAETMASSPGGAADWHVALRADPVRGVLASLGNLCIILENTYAHRLTFDEMAVTPCLDGKAVADEDVTQIRRELEREEQIAFSTDETWAAVISIAKQQSFHPVKQYLRGLVWDGTSRVGNVAAEYLGAPDPLSKVLVSRTLIATVARALDPGCQVDTILVLVGKESAGKSTFFRTLAGPWFADSAIDIGDRKGIMTLHAAWIYEWPEVERMMLKRTESEIKAFVTQRDDTFVPPYGRTVVKALRSTVVVGSTNEDRFLSTSTGHRRWWTVVVNGRVDIPRLIIERDQIWAEALVLYDEYLAQKKAGVADDDNDYRWHLNTCEDEQRKARNEEHATPSADEQTVGAWLAGEPIKCAACRGTGDGLGRDATGDLYPCTTCNGKKTTTRPALAKDSDGREYVTIVDVLSGPMALLVKDQDSRQTQRAVTVLRRLGWINGARIRPTGRTSLRVTPYYSTTSPADEPAPQEAAIVVAPAPDPRDELFALGPPCPSGTSCLDPACDLDHPGRDAYE
jgi:hypothetical protein